MDLEQIHLSLASVLGLLGFLAGVVASIVAWLGKAAWKAERNNLELRLTGMSEATRLVREENVKLRDALEVEKARSTGLEKEQIRHDARLKILEQGETEHAVAVEQMRDRMVSKEYLASEFRTQNVTLEHQNRTLSEIKYELGRKVSVGQMPAAKQSIRREDPPSDPPDDASRRR